MTGAPGTRPGRYLRRTLRLPADVGRSVVANPLATAATLLVWFATVVATVSVFQTVLWDAIRRDLLYDLLPSTYRETATLPSITPLDVIVLQVKAGAIVGLLTATLAAAFLGRDWLARRSDRPDGFPSDGQFALGLVAAALLFAGGVAVAYEFLVPPLIDAATGGPSPAFAPRYSVVGWVELVVLFCLSAGTAAATPFAFGALARWRVFGGAEIVTAAIGAAVLLAVLGVAVWPTELDAQIIWNAPLIASLAVGAALAGAVSDTGREEESRGRR